MGYEEVETVLPKDFVPKPDPKPEPIPEPVPSPKNDASNTAPEKPPLATELELPSKHSQAESLASSMISSVYDSDASESGRKKGNSRSRRNMMHRIKGSWRRASQRRRSRSTSRTRGGSVKCDASVSSKGSSTIGGDDNGGNGKGEKKKKKKRSFASRFGVIRKVDSNATEVRNNTTKARQEAGKLENESKEAEARDAKNATEEKAEEVDRSQRKGLPAVREASPANTTVTACTNDTSDKNVEGAIPADITEASSENVEGADSGFPVEDSIPVVAQDYSVEIGDENDQIQVTATMSTEVEPTTDSYPLKKTASNVSTSSNRSNRSNRSARSNKSSRSNKPMTSLPTPSSVSRSKQVEEAITFDDASQSAGGRSCNHVVDNSQALIPATEALSISGNPAPTKSTDNNKENSQANANTDGATDINGATPGSNALALKDSSTQAKWVKKVSLSIGGYKTSFQFSDPMANLSQTVNEALNVVSDSMNDANLMGEAKNLDNIGDKSEDERDYDENPTKLFMYLQQRAWGLALTQLKKAPEEAKVWVYRKVKSRPASNVHDGYGSQAIVAQSQALVVHEGDPEKLRWKLLPLHASIVLGAPPEVILEIIRAFPKASEKPDERGSLPVHLAASRLDVDPEGEKVVLQLFGAYPDSIEIQDRKGRTPPELAKLARMRKDAEEKRRRTALVQEDLGVEKTASSYEQEDGIRVSGSNEPEGGNADADDEDDVSIKSSRSWRNLIKKSKSTDTMDKRKKKKKKAKGGSLLSKAKSMDAWDRSKTVSFDNSDGSEDGDEEMGPGFAMLKPSKSYEARVKGEIYDDDDDQEGDEAQRATEDVFRKEKQVPNGYQTPQGAPSSTEVARSIPLPKSFAEDDLSVKSNKPIKKKKSRSRTPSPVDLEPNSPSPVASEEKEEEPMEEEDDQLDTPRENETLRVLLETAAENVGRGAEDVSEYLKVLEDEWVTDVEALRRIDGETLDTLLPIILSREVQRLMGQADSIDNKFLTEDKDNGKWVRDKEYGGRGRSPHKNKKKKRARRKKTDQARRFQSDSPQDVGLNTITEGEERSDDDMSIKTEAKTVISRSSSTSKVRIKEEAEELNSENEHEMQQEVEEEAPSEFDNELHIRKIHANLIADARKKFPTRESLEDAIRERQAEVEAAVNSGFDVDRQTLSRAALADDEVRKLLPLRLILPTVDDLTEMIGVLQVHKESALRNLNLNKAVSIQTEIDELQSQIDQEQSYVMRKKMNATKCSGCGDLFVPKKRMVGILRTSEPFCPKCKALSGGESSGDDLKQTASEESNKSNKSAGSGKIPRVASMEEKSIASKGSRASGKTKLKKSEEAFDKTDESVKQ